MGALGQASFLNQAVKQGQADSMQESHRGVLHWQSDWIHIITVRLIITRGPIVKKSLSQTYDKILVKITL